MMPKGSLAESEAGPLAMHPHLKRRSPAGHKVCPALAATCEGDPHLAEAEPSL